jgi:hypothetical protein
MEFPDLAVLNKLIANWPDLPLTEEQRKSTSKEDGKTYPALTQLKNLRKNMGQPIQYTRAKSDVIGGRQFGGHLQGLKKCFRHTLCQSYHDYDIVNAHPKMFSQYCKKKGYDISSLDCYLENRDELLGEIMETNNLTREEAKAIPLSILNGGAKGYDNLTVKPSWLKIFKIDIVEIQKSIMSDPENAELVKGLKAQKKRNLAGSVVNHILCHIEDTVLMEAIKFLKVQQPILCFDGFMSQQVCNLEGLQEHILETCKWDLEWAEKQMDQGIDLTEFHEKAETPKKSTNTDDDYLQWKDEFEKTVCQINFPTAYLIQSKYGNHLINKSDLTTIYSQDFNFLFNLWMRDPNRKSYHHMEFLPGLEVPEDVFNTFNGFNIPKTDKSGDIEPFIDLLDLVGNHEPITVEYIRQWTAHMFQKPGEMPRTAIVLRGDKGVGKNTYTETIKKVLGKSLYFETSDPVNELFGRFSTHKEDKLCLVLNETEAKQTFSNNQKIKDLITNPLMNIETKGLAGYTKNSFLRIFAHTNNDIPLKIEIGDRRFMVSQCSSKRKGDKDYWINFYNWLDKPESIKAIYNYLMSVKITLHFENDRPKTDAFFDIQEACFPHEIKWLVDLIVEEFPKTFHHGVSNLDLFTNYRQSLPTNYETSTIKFGKLMKKLEVPGFTKSKDGCMKWKIDRELAFKWLQEKQYTRETELKQEMELQFSDY